MKKQIYLMVVAACLGLLTKAQTVIPAYVPTNGLVGWWPFNGNANDLSVNANNGSLGNGIVLTSDRYSNINAAYNFSGTGNISLTNSPTSGNQDFTITGWAKTNNTSVRKGIACWGQDNPWSSTYFFITNTGYLNFGFAFNGGPQSSTFISDNVWHFVGVTCTNGLIQLYLDGNPTASPLQMNPNINGSNKAIGANIDNSGPNNFVGSLDDIGIWSRALTACEIKKLYTSGSFSVSSSSSNTICVGQSLNLTAAGATTYTWSTGATSQSISVSPTVSTVYSVSTTYSSGCTDNRTFSVTVNACTGLNEAESVINSLLIFPNPAKEQLNIMVNNNAIMGKKYSITNTLGQEVANGIFTKLTTELNIQQLAAGLYQLNIEGLHENYKFIKE